MLEGENEMKIENARTFKYERGTPGIVYVGRPSKWGNSYAIGYGRTRDEAIEKYREWIAQRPELIDELAALNPHTLVCWCAPERCHAEVLAELLEQRIEREEGKG